MLRHTRQTGILFAFAIPIVFGFLLSLVPTMHFLGDRVQRENLHLKEVQIYPADYELGSPAQLARAVRRGGRIDPTIQPRWWRYVLLKRTPEGVIEWFENDTLRGTYPDSNIATFDKAFMATYQTASTDTNTNLIVEVKVSPNRPMSEMIHFLDQLDVILIRGVHAGPAITEYRSTPILSREQLRHMDLLERQNRGLYLSGCGFSSGDIRLLEPDSTFKKQPVFGEEFEEVLDVLNPLPPIKVHNRK
jgi:hypothetical protein